MMIKKVLFFLFLPLVIHAQFVGTPYMAMPLPSFTVTFNYTGAIQNWTVPTGVSKINVTVSGAQGGGNSAVNGKGGIVNATLTVTPGQVLAIVVGGQPTSNVSVYGYGGAGGTVTSITGRNGYAGGGLSGIFLNLFNFNNALVVAGGGGGANGLNTLGTSGGGGNAGAPNGSNGAQGNYLGRSEGGKGATQIAGGAAGVSVDTQVAAPTNGEIINGGTGGTVSPSTWTAGGGGGAGYYGGGGGAGGGSSVGAGGGGSSYAISSATNVAYTSGGKTGNGQVVISY
jgi:hypothetical protein